MRKAAPAVLLLVLAFLFMPWAHAQGPAQAQAAAAPPETSASGPVPVPEPSDKAVQYYRSGNVLWVISTLWGLLVPMLLLFTGLSARMRDAARAIGRNWFFTVALYGIFFVVVTTLLSLPLDYYSGFVRPHAYGLSDQAVAKWWSDTITGVVIAGAAAFLLLWFPYLLLRKSPRRWWLYSGLAVIPLLAVVLFITPIWIEPLFNKFGPMKDKVL
ncbi:MAG TPA: M48 family peptidase, partial [Thermoanaerobaculia bacterium]